MLAAILNSRREAFNFQASEQQLLQNSAGGMDDPVAEITEAINRCAGASTADEQILAFHQHFLKHASFLHPLCYVPSRPDSRRHIIGIFMFYRSVVYETHFDVTHIAFDERPNGKEGKLFVDLLQTPKFRLWTTFTGFAPTIPMHIFFDVEKHEGKWWIVAEEDVIQPMVRLARLDDVMLADV